MIPQRAETPAPSPVKTGNIVVRENQSVLPNHFWIGVNGVNPAEN
jgi:hypothetical protein